jgi:hypothetical protein
VILCLKHVLGLGVIVTATVHGLLAGSLACLINHYIFRSGIHWTSHRLPLLRITSYFLEPWLPVL